MFHTSTAALQHCAISEQACLVAFHNEFYFPRERLQRKVMKAPPAGALKHILNPRMCGSAYHGLRSVIVERLIIRVSSERYTIESADIYLDILNEPRSGVRKCCSSALSMLLPYQGVLDISW